MRSDVTLQELTAKKTGTAGKAPPSHGGFCYFQIRFCFNVTSTPPTKFQTLLLKKRWPGSSTIHLVEPQTQESWLRSLLPGRLSPEPQLAVGYPQHQPGDAGHRGPASHFAQLAFREFPPEPFTPSRQTSDSGAAGNLSWSPTPEPYGAV